MYTSVKVLFEFELQKGYFCCSDTSAMRCCQLKFKFFFRAENSTCLLKRLCPIHIPWAEGGRKCRVFFYILDLFLMFLY